MLATFVKNLLPFLTDSVISPAWIEINGFGPTVHDDVFSDSRMELINEQLSGSVLPFIDGELMAANRELSA